MDNSVLSDESDYDVISNSGPRSLESSVTDLGLTSEVYEPPLLQAARDLFETASFSANDIQSYVHKALDCPGFRGAILPQYGTTVRIYVDGTFDTFNAGHALQLRQAKLSFSSVHLMVGVFSDDLCRLHNSPVTFSHVERCEVVRHCRWVDEVISDAPWTVDNQLVLRRKINYIALDEGTSVNPECDKVRLKGYDNMRMLGKVIPTRKTTGLTAARRSLPPVPLLTPVPTVKLLPTSPTATAPGEPKDRAVDIYGIYE